MIEFIIDGKNFSNLEEFYDEIEKAVDLWSDNWWRNLDAFNDIMRWGFWYIPIAQEYKLIWKNSFLSKKRLSTFSILIDILSENKYVYLVLE